MSDDRPTLRVGDYVIDREDEAESDENLRSGSLSNSNSNALTPSISTMGRPSPT